MTSRLQKPRQRGQALAEMGLVVLLFVTITLAIIDFGRMLMILNVITHAARDGARTAAVIPATQFPVGALGGSNLSTIQTRVRNQIATVMSTTDANAFSVSGTRVAGGGAGDTVRITVAGNVPYLFNFPGLWGGNVAVNRVATFRFEG
jgi:Flp pilus assembly protein TadG